MGSIFRIGAALVLGTVMVGAAFVAKGTADHSGAAAIAVGTYERTYYHTTDSDGDGMRDWEEELRGTDPRDADDWSSIPLAETEPASTTASTYQPPTTLTGRFAESFFEDYVRTSGGRALDEAKAAAFVNSSISSLAKEAQPDFYTRPDIVVGTDSDLDAIRTYGNRAAETIVLNTVVNQESPLLVLQKALREENPDMLLSLTLLKETYQKKIDDLLALPVPPNLVGEHLDLINMHAAVRNDISAMQEAFDDPLRALMSTKQYQANLKSLLVALGNIRAALEQNDVVYTNEEFGLFFFSLQP